MQLKPEQIVLLILKDNIRKNPKTTYGKNELISYLDQFEEELKDD